MESQQGKLVFSIGLDTKGLREGAEESTRLLHSIGQSAESEGQSIQQSLSTSLKDIPRVNINISADTANLTKIDAAFEQINAVVGLNNSAIRELQNEYNRLGVLADTALKKGTAEGDTELSSLMAQRQGITRLITVRKQAITEAERQADALATLEQKLRKEAETAEQSAAQHDRLRTKIRELTEEAAVLRIAAIEAGGDIDKNSGRYAEIIRQLGQLKDVQGDIQKASSHFANDEGQFAGIISGLSGVTGAFSAAQGAVALFGGANEDLQRVMLKVQSLMGITIGLQQLQQTLNKDSAFSQVTLNSLRSYWNKLLAVGRGEQIKGTAATKVDTASKKQQAVATTIGATSAKAATRANITLAGAFKMVSAAIKGIPGIGWIIAGVSALAGVVGHFVKKSKEADEAFKEQQEFLKDSREAYIKASVSVKDYIDKIDKFDGTQEQETKLISDLNSELGSQMGYCKSLASWKQTLIEKGDAYCKALEKEALAQAYLNKYVEASLVLQEAQEAYERKPRRKSAKAVEKAKADQQKADTDYRNALSDAKYLRDTYGLNYHEDPNIAQRANQRDKNAAEKRLSDQKKIIASYQKEVSKAIKDAKSNIDSQRLDARLYYLGDGINADIERIKAEGDKQIEQLRAYYTQLGQAKKDAAKSYYMSHDGASEEGWAASSQGQMTDVQWTQNVLSTKLADGKTLRDLFNTELSGIRMGVSRSIADLYDELLSKYQDYNTRRANEDKKYNADRKALEEAPIDPTEREAALAELKRQHEEVIKSINNEEAESLQSSSSLMVDLFSDATDKTEKQMRTVLSDAKALIEYLKGTKSEDITPQFGFTVEQLRALASSPDKLKALIDKVKELEETLSRGNPFRQLNDEIKRLKALLKDGGEVGIETFKRLSSAAASCASQVGGIVSALGQIADSTGNETLQATVQGASDVLSSFQTIAEDFAQGGIVGGAVALLKESLGWISKGFQAHDRRLQRSIESQQDKIESLKNAYDGLSSEVNKYYSSAKASAIEQMNANLQRQIELIQQQRQMESEKKKSDKDALKEYDDAEKELRDQIRSNAELARDAIFGEDLKSAIEAFASAYADAWDSGESRAQSAKDTVRKMMQQMVSESIKGAIQASGAMDQIRLKLEEFYADNVFSGWEQDYIYSMAESLQQELDGQFGWADKLLSDEGEDSRSASAKGIATASQDSVDELNGRMTAIQGHTFDIREQTISIAEGTRLMLSVANDILRSVISIEGNTCETNSRLDDLQGGMRALRSDINDIAVKGVRIKS